MPAPSFISATTSSPTGGTGPTVDVGPITVRDGDVLVAFGFMGQSATPNDLLLTTLSGSTTGWTLDSDNNTLVASASNPYLRAWSARATATGTFTARFTQTTLAQEMDGHIQVWRNSAGIGGVSRNDNNHASGAPTVSITTTKANSALVFADCDWSDAAGAVTFTSTGGATVTDLSDQTNPTGVFMYAAHVNDAGAIGAKTFGMTSPNTQRYICDVYEILGYDPFKQHQWFPPTPVKKLTRRPDEQILPLNTKLFTNPIPNKQTEWPRTVNIRIGGPPQLLPLNLNLYKNLTPLNSPDMSSSRFKSFQPPITYLNLTALNAVVVVDSPILNIDWSMRPRREVLPDVIYPNISVLDLLSTPFSQDSWPPTRLRLPNPKDINIGFIKPNPYSLPLDAGNFILTGVADTLTSSRNLSAGQGNFVLNGQAVTETKTMRLPAAAGNFILNGQPANLNKALSLALGQGNFILTGKAVTTPRGVTISAANGNFTLNGKAITNPVALSVLAGTGNIIFNGQDATINYVPFGGGGGPLASNNLPFLVTVGPLTAR